MRMNSLMRDIAGVRLGRDLPDDLQEIVDAGWTVGPAGALLLTVQSRGRWNADVDEAKLGGHEYEINDIHVSTADLSPAAADFLPRAAGRALSFALCALERAAGLPGADRLTAVVSVPVDEEFLDSGSTVKFFTRRGDHPDWFTDLERFRLDGVALVDPDDALPGPPGR